MAGSSSAKRPPPASSSGSPRSSYRSCSATSILRRHVRLTGIGAPLNVGSVSWERIEAHVSQAGLRNQIELLTGLLADHSTGLLITLDEIHRNQIGELRELATTVQHAFREGRERGQPFPRLLRPSRTQPPKACCRLSRVRTRRRPVTAGRSRIPARRRRPARAAPRALPRSRPTRRPSACPGPAPRRPWP